MYAIPVVIFGLPLHTNERKQVEHSEALESALETDDAGFITYYSGGSDVAPQAFGVELCQFDEACHHVNVSTLVLKPNAKEKKTFNSLWASLSDELRKELTTNYGTPRVFILWTTS